MNDDQNYTAYLMTILADSSYLQNDYTKLARNSYSKRDANFSGFVFYSTPAGNLVKGWHYLNGKVDKIVSPSASSQPPALQVQSLAAAKKTDDVSNCYIQEYSLYLGTYCLSTFDYAPTCTDYYADYNEQICDTQSLPPDDNPGGSSGPGFPDPSGNPTPPPVINDPCATAKGATANSDFNAKIADLKNYTSDTNGEHGWVYSQNADGSFSYKPLTSTTDPNSIDIPLTTVISNLLHNHFTGQLLNFSDDDIAAPFIIYNNKFMANTTSFTSTVVTPYGTYMLVISDPAEFKAFASNNPQSTIQTSLSLFGYSTSTSGPDAEKIIAKVLANINGGTGLSLLRQDSDGFKLLTIIGNQVNTTNCN